MTKRARMDVWLVVGVVLCAASGCGEPPVSPPAATETTSGGGETGDDEATGAGSGDPTGDTSVGPAVPPADGEGEVLAATVACAPSDCGPRPGMPTQQCADGSRGGNTGRCQRSPGATRCGWEIRECPSGP